MGTQDPEHALYLRDLGTVLKERARDARRSRQTEGNDFQRGRLVAYYEVISTMRNQAGAFDLTPEDLNLHDIDPDRDLL